MKQVWRIMGALGILAIIAGLVSSCLPNRAIEIGLAAQLTGRQSELGIATRNGAQLAVDEINASGGINGRPLQLVIVDDQGDPEVARAVDQQLIERGVAAIIGHPTSAMTAAVLELIEENEIVLLSGTSTSSSFSGKDDYFFRICPSNDFMGYMAARHLAEDETVHTLSGIYDLNNQAFTETFWSSVRDEFTRQGGTIQTSYPFKSGETDLSQIIHEMAQTDVDAIFIAASAVDTALMVQYAQQAGLKAHLISSSWAQTQELIQKGGRGIGEIHLLAIYNPHHSSAAYQQFIANFTERYGRPPTLGASHGYEAVMTIAAALSETQGQTEGLRDALKGLCIDGLQGKFCINEFGDVEREIYILRVEDQAFVTEETIQPQTTP